MSGSPTPFLLYLLCIQTSERLIRLKGKPSLFGHWMTAEPRGVASSHSSHVNANCCKSRKFWPKTVLGSKPAIVRIYKINASVLRVACFHDQINIFPYLGTVCRVVGNSHQQIIVELDTVGAGQVTEKQWLDGTVRCIPVNAIFGPTHARGIQSQLEFFL